MNNRFFLNFNLYRLLTQTLFVFCFFRAGTYPIRLHPQPSRSGRVGDAGRQRDGFDPGKPGLVHSARQ